MMSGHCSMPTQLDNAIKAVLDTLEKRPDKNLLNIWSDLERGCRPQYPPVGINRPLLPEKTQAPQPKSETEKLSAQIEGMLKPLELENPISPILCPSYGDTGMMAAALGAKLNLDDPEYYGGGIVEHIPFEKAVDMDTPDPADTIASQEIRKQIESYLKHTPDDFKINLPDMAGPFNIAASLVGSDLYYKLTDVPEQVHTLMKKITSFWIRTYELFCSWIPQGRFTPPYAGRCLRIAECSCNLISKQIYREFVAPCDRKLAQTQDKIYMHPCSGPHVFEETLEEIPKVAITEAGYIENTTAGSITVDDAIDIIAARPIILVVGEELQPGLEEQTICRHISFLDRHPRMLLAYTGMHWTKEDEPTLRKLHERIDEYYS